MQMRHYPKAHSSITHGNAPWFWYGSERPDGDVGNWAKAPVGSTYIYAPSANLREEYRKILDDQRDGDWLIVNGVFAQRIAITDSGWTDGGSASGTKVLDFTIPVGAQVTKTLYRDIVGFTGNTSATLVIGDGTDPDRYMTGTPSVFTTAAGVSTGAVSGTAYHASAISTVTATLAGNSDFGAITAGSVQVVIFYQQ